MLRLAAIIPYRASEMNDEFHGRVAEAFAWRSGHVHTMRMYIIDVGEP